MDAEARLNREIEDIENDCDLSPKEKSAAIRELELSYGDAIQAEQHRYNVE